MIEIIIQNDKANEYEGDIDDSEVNENDMMTPRHQSLEIMNVKNAHIMRINVNST